VCVNVDNHYGAIVNFVKESQRVRIIGATSFLHERARKRAIRGAMLIIAGIALVLTFFFQATVGNSGFMGGLPAFLGMGALVVGWRQMLAAKSDRESAAGEGPVATQLSARLGEEYLYLRRVSLPGQGLEADGILLGPHGALVLGIVVMQGKVIVRGDDWFTLDSVGHEQPLRHSPTWQLMRRVRGLQRILLHEGTGKIPVQGAVVLLEGELKEADRPGLAVVPLHRIASYVDYLRQEGSEDTDALRSAVQQLAKILIAAAARTQAGVRTETQPVDVR
jgi:hypothetical protein